MSQLPRVSPVGNGKILSPRSHTASTIPIGLDTFTNNTNKPFDPDYTGRYVLYGQNYEFAIGSMIWRGHFEATGKETGMNISLSAGPFGVGAFYVSMLSSCAERTLRLS